MRYMSSDPFLTRKGEPFKLVRDPDNPDATEDLTNPMFLLSVLEQYQPTQGQVLSNAEMRKMNQLQDVLEGVGGNVLPEDGIFVIEDSLWEVAKKVCDWRLPLMGSGWARSGPPCLDMLDGLPTEDPRVQESEDESPNGVPDNVTQMTPADVS